MGIGKTLKAIDSHDFAFSGLDPKLKSAIKAYDVEMERLEARSARGVRIPNEKIQEIKSEIPDIDDALKRYEDETKKFEVLTRGEVKIQ